MMEQKIIYKYQDCTIFVSDPFLNYNWEEKIEGLVCVKKTNTFDESSITQTGWCQISTYCITPNGEEYVVSESLYKNGRLHGPQRCWYPTSIQTEPGQERKSTESWYKDGIRHGAFFVWHPQAQTLLIQAFYNNGHRHGRHQYWTEEGYIRGELEFQDGVFHGTMKSYNPNVKSFGPGIVSRSQEWKKGVRDGIDVLYHGDEGFLLFCDEWKKGVKEKVVFEDVLEKNLHPQPEKSIKGSNQKSISRS